MSGWDVLGRRIVYSAQPFLEVAVEKVRLPDGRAVDDYHQVAAGTFAGIVAETIDGEILLLRQYRHGIRRVALSLPGGRVEIGEPPLAAAQRELLEETGFVAEQWRELAGYHTSCTYGFSYSYFFHARGLARSSAPNSDDLETSEIIFLDRARAQNAILAGEFSSIGHALPLAMVLLDGFGDPRSGVRSVSAFVPFSPTM